MPYQNPPEICPVCKEKANLKFFLNMSLGWFKNRVTDLKYFCWIIKNWNYLKRGKYSLAPFFKYWVLYPIPRLFFGINKASDISQKIIKRLTDGKLIIPLPINSSNTYYISIRDSGDFDVFREVCIDNHYNFSQIKPGMTVVDVGAHIGTFTLLASKKVHSNGRVIAIEPEPNNFAQLIENLKLNNIKNVIPVNIALSSFNGEKDFFISKDFSCHSFFPLPRRNLGKIKIKVRSLDSLMEEFKIEKVDLLKIDAEGAEVEIIKGARETLIKNPKMKMIIAAYHFPQEISEIAEYLKFLNFKLQIYKDLIVVN